MEQGGKHATPALRVTQFPRVIEVRGAAMWCTFRQVPVGFQEKCTAANHVKSANIWTEFKETNPPRVHPRKLLLN